MAAEIDLSMLDAFEYHAGPQCSVGRLLTDESGFGEANGTLLRAALLTSRTSAALARWIESQGHHMRAQSVSRHRAKECSCE